MTSLPNYETMMPDTLSPCTLRNVLYLSGQIECVSVTRTHA